MDAQLIVPLFAVFISVAIAAGALVSYVLRRASSVDRRLRDMTGSPAAAVSLTDLDLTRPSYGSLERIVNFVPKSPKELSNLRKRLAAGGYDQAEFAVLYSLAEIALAIAFGVGVYLYFRTVMPGLFLAAVAAAIGYLLPGLWLSQQIAKRKRQIQNGLPDALDLLLVTMEAGSGLDQAIVKVSNELQLPFPALAGEFRHIVTEMRAGRPRADALRQFADRTKVEDVRALAMTLIQTDKFGTSVGQALRTHAEVARTKRRQRAEERAQKLGVKLVFPLVFCLFPAMYVVVLGPAILRIIRVFSSQAVR
jgi:tight adherence protein C